MSKRKSSLFRLSLSKFCKLLSVECEWSVENKNSMIMPVKCLVGKRGVSTADSDADVAVYFEPDTNYEHINSCLSITQRPFKNIICIRSIFLVIS